MWNYVFPEVVLWMCRLFLYAPQKHRALEVWRIPPQDSQYAYKHLTRPSIVYVSSQAELIRT